MAGDYQRLDEIGRLMSGGPTRRTVMTSGPRIVRRAMITPDFLHALRESGVPEA